VEIRKWGRNGGGATGWDTVAPAGPGGFSGQRLAAFPGVVEERDEIEVRVTANAAVFTGRRRWSELAATAAVRRRRCGGEHGSVSPTLMPMAAPAKGERWRSRRRRPHGGGGRRRRLWRAVYG